MAFDKQFIGKDTAKGAAILDLSDRVDALELGQLPDDAIGTDEIADAAVTEPKLADGSVSTAKIQADAVTATEINDGAVGTAALAGGAATGAKLAPTGVKSGSFAGVAAPGPCVLTGAAIGDRVLGVMRQDAAAGAVGQQANFEAVITVADQIQQTGGGDLSLQTFGVILLPAAS